MISSSALFQGIVIVGTGPSSWTTNTSSGRTWGCDPARPRGGRGIAEPSILWRRLDRPGHEAARLIAQPSGWRLIGTSVFAHERQPCRLDYVVTCDARWFTVCGRVTGWVGQERVEIELSVDAACRWRLNGHDCPAVAGCTDLDLNWSPSTNLLPIRRLDLRLGQEGEARAAWLRFPSFALEPLEQRYRRTGTGTYRYESAGGAFVTELQVNPDGLVTLYPDLWTEDPG